MVPLGISELSIIIIVGNYQVLTSRDFIILNMRDHKYYHRTK